MIFNWKNRGSVGMSKKKQGHIKQHGVIGYFLQLLQSLQLLQLDCTRESLERTLSLLILSGITGNRVRTLCGHTIHRTSHLKSASLNYILELKWIYLAVIL